MHFVIIGGDGVQLLGGYIPPIPPRFGTAGCKQLATDNLLRTTCYRQLAIDNLLQTTCCRQLATDNLLQTTCYRQLAADNLLQKT